MPNVKFEHPDLAARRRQYELIEDCMGGETTVKFRQERYLPRPNAADLSNENRQRYNAYITRSVFYNVTRRTVAGLVGIVFDTDPTAVIPDKLKPVVSDASGGGINLEQLAKKAVGLAISEGRLGLFVDFPQAPEEGLNAAEASELLPNITVYKALDVINWRVEEIEGRDRLTLVVLREDYIVSDDGFEQKKNTQYRVLSLVATPEGERKYVAQIWRGTNTSNFVVFKSFDNISGADGQPLEDIPFTFVGSENNDADVDDPPMYDLASLNIAHYRNSADYEEACFLVGQPTPWFSGLSEDWVTRVLKGKVELGSRAAIPLPENATAGILQAEKNSMAFEAMQHKEKQMVAIGARLIEQADVQRTATDAIIENAGENSVIGDVARNVSSAIELALRYAMLFLSATPVPDAQIKYQISTTFGLGDMPSDELTALVAAWQEGAISWTEFRERLRKGKLATQDDTVAKKEIAADQATRDAADIAKQSQIAEKTAEASAKFPKPAGPRLPA